MHTLSQLLRAAKFRHARSSIGTRNSDSIHRGPHVLPPLTAGNHIAMSTHSSSSRKVFNDLFQGVTKLNLRTQSHHVGAQTILAALPISSCSITPKYLTFIQCSSAIHSFIQILPNHVADALHARPHPLSLSQRPRAGGLHLRQWLLPSPCLQEFSASSNLLSLGLGQVGPDAELMPRMIFDQ